MHVAPMWRNTSICISLRATCVLCNTNYTESTQVRLNHCGMKEWGGRHKKTTWIKEFAYTFHLFHLRFHLSGDQLTVMALGFWRTPLTRNSYTPSNIVQTPVRKSRRTRSECVYTRTYIHVYLRDGYLMVCAADPVRCKRGWMYYHHTALMGNWGTVSTCYAWGTEAALCLKCDCASVDSRTWTLVGEWWGGAQLTVSIDSRKFFVNWRSYNFAERTLADCRSWETCTKIRGKGSCGRRQYREIFPKVSPTKASG
jgi:hypothetical protein